MFLTSILEALENYLYIILNQDMMFPFLTALYLRKLLNLISYHIGTAAAFSNNERLWKILNIFRFEKIFLMLCEI